MPGYQTIIGAEQRLFRIYPLRELAHAGLIRKRVAPGAPVVLVCGADGRGVVERIDGPHAADQERVRARAEKLADATGDPVIVGELVAVADDGPVWRTCGQVITRKADPLSDKAFDSWVRQASARLGVIADQEAITMVREAAEWLDFDWDSASQRQWRQASSRLTRTFSTPSSGMIRAQQVSMSTGLRNQMRRITNHMARTPQLRGRIAAGYRVPDRVASQMVRDHSFWVRDKYGKVAPRLTDQARRIISDGLGRGLGRNAIGRDLARTIRGGLQMPGYWQTVSANAVARGRAYSMGGSMRAARIEFARIEAILDENTTETCLMLHDRLIPVEGAMRLLDRALADPQPQAALVHTPFTVEDPETGEIATVQPDGERSVIGRVTAPGAGTGTPGRYADVRGPNGLVAASVGFPPYHHQCRTTTVAEV